jgi:hypothetical protein
MSESQLAASTAKSELTEVKRITGNVRDLVAGAIDLSGRLSALKYRLSGIQDDAEVASDAPEPVRNDLEELDYQLSLIRNNFNQIDIHIGHLERI